MLAVFSKQMGIAVSRKVNTENTRILREQEKLCVRTNLIEYINANKSSQVQELAPDIEPEKVADIPIEYNKSFVSPSWFIDSWVKKLTVSPAEQLIVNELQKYQLVWYREVSFRDMQLSPKGAPYRYDFYLPVYGIVIEYHGKQWHSTPEKLAIDELKMKFCKANNIKVITYSTEHYYRLSCEIEQLMDELGVDVMVS